MTADAPAITTSGTSAAAYGESDDALDSWEDLSITTQFDGEDVLIDAAPADADPDDYPLGRPGVGIRVKPEQAIDLAIALLQSADAAGKTQIVNDIIAALEEAGEDLSYRANEGRDYEPEDMPGIKAKLRRWNKLATRLSKEIA